MQYFFFSFSFSKEEDRQMFGEAVWTGQAVLPSNSQIIFASSRTQHEQPWATHTSKEGKKSIEHYCAGNQQSLIRQRRKSPLQPRRGFVPCHFIRPKPAHNHGMRLFNCPSRVPLTHPLLFLFEQISSSKRKKINRAFSGKSAVDWICQQKVGLTREAAVEVFL